MGQKFVIVCWEVVLSWTCCRWHPPLRLFYSQFSRQISAAASGEAPRRKKGNCRADAEQVDVLEQEMLVQKSLGRDASWVAPDCLRTLRIAHTVAQWLVSSCIV